MYKTNKQKEPELNEAFELYLGDVRKKLDIKKFRSLRDFFDNKLLVVYSIQKGIPYSLFQQIKEAIPFTDKDWAEFLNISIKSLQRYKTKKDYRFRPIHSEKIIELAEVAYLGKEVFESFDKFYLWLHTPLYALGNMKPVDLLKNSYGKEMVTDELNRIDHGIFI
ncbi:MAG: DUF2384 domain-containing protein [Chlorobi bacterium]|nr:DUF2384 domain-containing protein [Chlorobiota bacterium]